MVSLTVPRVRIKADLSLENSYLKTLFSDGLIVKSLNHRFACACYVKESVKSDYLVVRGERWPHTVKHSLTIDWLTKEDQRVNNSGDCLAAL